MTGESIKPLVSMIVLCYNQARFVVETLESVRAQTYKNTELIIIDDCSTDDSVAIIERWLQETGTACTFIRHEKNMGVCKTVNDALAHATGKYISMIASDDLWLPDKIDRQVQLMEAEPEEVGVVYSQAFRIDEEGRPLPGIHTGANFELAEMPQGNVLDMMVRGWVVQPQTALIRRSCYDRVGVYDEALPWEDLDMFFRIARHYSFAYSPAPSAKYRFHQSSLSRSDPCRVCEGLCTIFRKQLRLGGLTEPQRAALSETMLGVAWYLYRLDRARAADVLSDVWQSTRHARAWWMYRFAKFGIPFAVWNAMTAGRHVWPLRNYLWHPILNATRGIRHPLGLSQSGFRALLKRR